MFFIKEHGDLLSKVYKKTENLNPKIFKTKNGRLIMQSKFPDCRTKKSIFVKEPDASDSFMPEMHLKQPGFTYSPCGPFTKNK